MTRPAISHLYIHVPFCASKCGYCALYSICDATPDCLASYPSAIATELADASQRIGLEIAPRTIYIGGGTPTLLGPRLGELLSMLRDRLDLSNLEEFSIESRPDFITGDIAGMLAANGVNRVSMGVQTFDAATLLALGRNVRSDAVASAFAALRYVGIRNIGIDLITGLPGASACQTVRDINEAARLDPTHVSVYSLIVEPGTPVAKRIESGEIEAPSDDNLMDSIAEADETLSALGFNRYEISNYARQGKECKYNLAVWRGEDYLGLGPSASSRAGLMRWTNAPDVHKYLEAAKNGAPFFRECEEQSPEDDAEGRFIFQLRLSEGADPAAFAEAHPAARALLTHWISVLEEAGRQGLVEQTATRWRLTPRGREVADSVLEMLC